MMRNTNFKVGIIGLGFLGMAMENYFTEKEAELYRYDKNGIGSKDKVNQADVVFICVNTPYDKEKKDVDLSYIDSALKILEGEKIVVLRSTVPPGTTDEFQKRYPAHKLLFNPEFLRAKFAAEDFKKPSRQIIGFTDQSREAAGDVLALLPKAPDEYTKIIPAKEAEFVKCASNTILAAKVALANKVFEFSQKLGMNYEEIKRLIGADPRIGHYGFDVFYDGFRGYNGGCFPKDVRTMISTGEKLGVNMKWLKTMDDENLKLLYDQGLEPDYGYPTQK